LVEWTQDDVAVSMPEDPQVTAVRDPFIFRFEGRRYAVQGAGLADGRAALLLYRVEDMSNWEYQGIWLTTDNAAGAGHAVNRAEIWECPQLLRIPDGQGGTAWLAMFSLWQKDDDHEHALGVGHLIGTMAADPATGLPVFTPQSAGKSDFGRDFYAPQVTQLDDAADGTPRALLWGWANEGPGRDGRRGRSQDEIDAAGWAGVLTHPRVLSLVDGALAVAPAPELDGYRAAQLAEAAVGQVLLPPLAEARISAGASFAGGEVRLVLGEGQSVFAGPLAAGEELRVFIDASLVEVYRSGSAATTLRAYPAPGEEWRLELPAGASAEVWELAGAPS
jgi:beta-fructofuranosidase